MLQLFRQAHIQPHLNRYVVMLSLVATVGWLYFSFIEKALLAKLFEGQALIVDLVFGLPLVLMMAVIVYAICYWSCKLLIIWLWPQQLYFIDLYQEESDLINDDSHIAESHDSIAETKAVPDDDNKITRL